MFCKCFSDNPSAMPDRYCRVCIRKKKENIFGKKFRAFFFFAEDAERLPDFSAQNRTAATDFGGSEKRIPSGVFSKASVFPFRPQKRFTSFPSGRARVF